MQQSILPSNFYEEDANRVRAGLRSTFAQLQNNLAPANLLDEMARGSGVRDISPAGVFEFAARRHPVPTALIGLGFVVWALTRTRGRLSNDRQYPAQGALRDAAGSLAGTATSVFRDRAEAKRQALLGAANSYMKTGAAQLSDVMEKSVDALVGKVPATAASRPLVEALIQMALLAALEAVLPKPR